MAVEVTMPQMGESVVEGTVTKWLVREGEEVKEDQPLAEISTDKVDTEIPSPAAGVIMKIVADEGQTLPIGATIAVIDSASVASTSASPAGAKAAAAEIKMTPVEEVKPPPQKRPAPPPASISTSARYSPLVLRMAAEHQIELSKIQGTGLGGRISKRDVLRYLEARGKALPDEHPLLRAADESTPAPEAAVARPGPPVPPGRPSIFKPPVYQTREGDTVEPFTHRRKLIAEHMVFSKTHSPHVPTLAEVDMTAVARTREAKKEAFRQREGFGLQFLPFVALATARALEEFPRMNASVVNDSLVVRKEINLGIAVDTEEGLLVPVIRGPGRMSVAEVARAIDAMARKAADRKITADDLSGGSFTLSNPGREGNLFGFAIINQPQVGILRMGEIKKRPVVIELDGEDVIAIRTIMYLTLSYDHRVIDGVLGNRFLYRVARILEEGNFEI